ncbi:MAG: YveK family protein [Clostridium sp.]|uniref:YveK family protein n=1 Tax=Clostridium sp. TaxID=1506 RepID=UPI003D6CE033
MNYETTVGYKEFINVIKRGKWIILLLTLLLTLTATAISIYSMKSSKPIYQTKTSLIIGQKEDISNAKGLMGTFEEIARSSTIAKNASVALKGSVSLAKIQESYEVSVADSAPILTITASGKSQKESVVIASAVYNSFTKEVKRIYPTQTLKVMENSAQNGIVNSKFKILNVILAFLLGLFISIFVVTFIGYFDEKIRTKEDVERYLGLDVIGNLPKRKATDI